MAQDREKIVKELAGESTELCFAVDTAVRRLIWAAEGITDKAVKSDLQSLTDAMIRRKLAVRKAIKKLYPERPRKRG